MLASDAIAEEQKIEVDMVGLDDEVSSGPAEGSIACGAVAFVTVFPSVHCAVHPCLAQCGVRLVGPPALHVGVLTESLCLNMACAGVLRTGVLCVRCAGGAC